MNRRAFLYSLPALALVPGCTPTLGMFDAVAPRDGGGRMAVRDAEYGENRRQRLDVYRPADGEAPAPVIVFIYGGSWRSGDKDDYEWLGVALAAQGFVVAVPDYRVVPEVRFPGFVEDCAAAVGWVSQNIGAYGGDPSRIVLMGHSAGGYNAIMLALAGDYLRAAGVDASSVRGAIGLAGPYDFYPFDVDASRDAFGQTADPRVTQPVNFARGDAPPLLLLWGADDDTVGPRNLESLARMQRAAGGAVETKIYPRVDHIDILLAISRPFRREAPVLGDVTAFARRVTA